MSLLDFNPYLGNIFAVYARADKEDRDFGMFAYERYSARIQDVLTAHEVNTGEWVPLFIGAAVFAVLSPNTDEANNFLGLERILQRRPDAEVPGYPANKAKARLMYIDHINPLEVLGGLKVRSFYRNLATPRDESAPIVIDAHIYSARHLKRFRVHKVPYIGPTLYTAIDSEFRTVARVLGIRPNQLQATVWSTWKRINNIVFDAQRKLPL